MKDLDHLKKQALISLELRADTKLNITFAELNKFIQLVKRIITKKDVRGTNDTFSRPQAHGKLNQLQFMGELIGVQPETGIKHERNHRPHITHLFLGQFISSMSGETRVKNFFDFWMLI